MDFGAAAAEYSFKKGTGARVGAVLQCNLCLCGPLSYCYVLFKLFCPEIIAGNTYTNLIICRVGSAVSVVIYMVTSPEPPPPPPLLLPATFQIIDSDLITGFIHLS